jgi:hypothetical protein
MVHTPTCFIELRFLYNATKLRGTHKKQNTYYIKCYELRFASVNEKTKIERYAMLC